MDGACGWKKYEWRIYFISTKKLAIQKGSIGTTFYQISQFYNNIIRLMHHIIIH